MPDLPGHRGDRCQRRRAGDVQSGACTPGRHRRDRPLGVVGISAPRSWSPGVRRPGLTVHRSAAALGRARGSAGAPGPQARIFAQPSSTRAMTTVVNFIDRWSQTPSTRAYSSSSYPHIHHDDPSSRRQGLRRSHRPWARSPVHLDAGLDEQVPGKREGRRSQAGGDGRTTDVSPETGATVPDAVFGEQSGGRLGDLPEGVHIDQRAPREPLVHQIAVAGLEGLDLEHRLGGLHPPLQSGYLGGQLLDGGHVPSWSAGSIGGPGPGGRSRGYRPAPPDRRSPTGPGLGSRTTRWRERSPTAGPSAPGLPAIGPRIVVRGPQQQPPALRFDDDEDPLEPAAAILRSISD